MSMNFHAVKWKNLEFIRSDGICKCFYATCCIFLHKFEQRFSYIARACEENYILLEIDSYIVTCCRNDKVSALYRMKIHQVFK